MVAEADRRDFWQGHVDAWWESGRTQRAYCQEHGLCEAQFSHWKGRLRKGPRRRGVETQLVVYPDESHSITLPSFRKDRWERYLDWYATHVRGQ